MENAGVSIIIPTYNHAHVLCEAIDSAFAQSHNNFEIIVIDDGSTDSTLDVVARYGPTLRYVRQSNAGLSAARNTGIRAARERHLVFLDADDRLMSNQIELSLRALDGEPDAGLVCGDIETFGVRDFDHVHSCAASPTHYATLLRGCFIVNIGACLVPRHVFDQVGKFDESLPSSEDWDLFLRIARKFPITCHHVPVLQYRRSPDQMSRDFCRMLSGSMTVLKRQRQFLDSIALKTAYEEGRIDIARYYASPLAAQTRKLIEIGAWREALRNATCLLNYYPSQLLGIFDELPSHLWS